MITPHGEMLDTIIEGGTGSMSMDYMQPATMPDRFESGTINATGIIGLHAGIQFLHNRNGTDLSA
jgi:selenocysteine lyase/cysteine desulfurase